MSYCRWSSDNFRCDLYCYEDVSGGWTIHVAGGRRVGEYPDDPTPAMLAYKITPEEWAEQHRLYMAAIDKTPIEPIDLPHSGETFNEPDLESFLERLMELRAIGYRFPDYVIEDVKQEIAEELTDK